jgi:hypothetical protein
MHNCLRYSDSSLLWKRDYMVEHTFLIFFLSGLIPGETRVGLHVRCVDNNASSTVHNGHNPHNLFRVYNAIINLSILPIPSLTRPSQSTQS